ncbi:hypothetical protein ACH5RR_010960 [Cinchona calisaya]|uniref:C2 NT-type domain-containing protein n=1 Tax=Cinchona calisaya TaxID=153742 RepID=A0ABD3A3J4_9GENT
MVLGLKAKNRKNPSVQVDYLIHIQEVKPWPPSQSLRTLHAVLVQWEHGDRSSGSTDQVVPSLGTGSGVGDGRIEFNESFRLPVTLLRDLSVKGGNGDTFQKNYIEFNLYEPQRDKTAIGQLLGSAVVDLADYGVVKDTLSISTPINCKRTYRNTSQPLLFLKIQSVEKSWVSSSSRDRLTMEASMDRNSVDDSVSALMNEAYAEEAETSSFTDDDVSSRSSLAVYSSAVESNGGSPPQNKESELGRKQTSVRRTEDVCLPSLEQQLVKADDKQLTTSNLSLKRASSHSSSIDLTSDLAWITKKIGARSAQSSSSPMVHEVKEKANSNYRSATAFVGVPCDIGKNILGGSSDATSTVEQRTDANICSPLNKEAFPDSNLSGDENLGCINTFNPHINGVFDNKAAVTKEEGRSNSDLTQNGYAESENFEIYQENGKQREIMEKMEQCIEDEPTDNFSQDDFRGLDSFESDALSPSREHLSIKSSLQNIDSHNKHEKSVRSSMDSNKIYGSVRAKQFILGDRGSGALDFISNELIDTMVHSKETRVILSDSRINQLEQKLKRLEAELREAAAIEVGLYSVVAEHGSSTNKVHAPARRLSRFYLYASRAHSQSQRGTAAKSAISGLILVAKACGNDVPRLTFWLSNSIMLRAIISESLREQKIPFSGPVTEKNGVRNAKNISSFLKWNSLSSKGIESTLDEGSDDWDDPNTYITALGKVESWIFSRIIESIWWQTLTPHMQSDAAKAIHRGIFLDSNKKYRRTSSSDDQEQGAFSLELWKMAFRDACERICPVRAEGHECGCLPILSRLVMEQCVARLDVAMFNAILRESVDDIPTDPVSDPISDANVLPVPVGNASFGTGAQLKNAIGNWSRWLTDLLGVDDDDSLDDVVNSACGTSDDENKGQDTSLKSFNLLNALSDLMMLPKDMLLSRTIRKEVCPTFGPTLIRRIMNAFVPDEFCPEPVPKVVLEALNSEDSFDNEEDYVNFPFSAAPIVYLPPSAASVVGIIGDAGNHYRLARQGSLVLAKSYTSDDELDELVSPLSSIIIGGVQGSSSSNTILTSRGNISQNTTRYQLLREVWKDSE